MINYYYCVLRGGCAPLELYTLRELNEVGRWKLGGGRADKYSEVRNAMFHTGGRDLMLRGRILTNVKKRLEWPIKGVFLHNCL